MGEPFSLSWTRGTKKGIKEQLLRTALLRLLVQDILWTPVLGYLMETVSTADSWSQIGGGDKKPHLSAVTQMTVSLTVSLQLICPSLFRDMSIVELTCLRGWAWGLLVHTKFFSLILFTLFVVCLSHRDSRHTIGYKPMQTGSIRQSLSSAVGLGKQN